MKFSNQQFIRGRMYRDEASAEGGAEGASAEATESAEAPSDNASADAADLERQLQALRRNHDELLRERKRDAELRAEAERKAKEKERAEAEAKGNYEQLFKSSEQERQSLQEQLEELTNKIHMEKVGSEASRLAAALNPVSEYAAEDLAKHIASRLKFTDDGVKVTDTNGNLTVSTLDDLKKEIAGSARYSHLIKGAQSSGGGASGGSSLGGGAAKEISRADFGKLDPASRMKFVKDGGKVVDN